MKVIATIKKKRICKFFNCNNVLSIYNPGNYCYVHQREVDNKKHPPLSSTSAR